MRSGRAKVRRIAWWLIGLAAAAVVLVAVTVAFRVTLAERVAEAYLSGRGFPDSSVSVSQLGLQRSVVVELAFGPGLPSIARLEADYRISGFFKPRLLAVRVEGLRAVIDLHAPAAMGRLAALAPAGADGGPATPGPVIELQDARVTLRNTGAGDVSLAFDGSADLSQARARATLAGAMQGIPKTTVRAVDAAEILLRTKDRINEDGGVPQIAARLSASLAEAGTAGSLRARFEWASREPLEFPVQVSADVRAQGISMAAGQVESMSWRGEGSVTTGAAKLAGPVEARLPILQLGDLAAKDIAFGGRLDIEGGPAGNLAVTLADGSARISAPPSFGRLRLRGPVRFEIPSARLARKSRDAFGLEARILPGALDGMFDLQSGDDVVLAATAKQIDISLQVANQATGRLRLSGGAVRLPARNIAVEKIEADIPLVLQTGGEPAVVSGAVRNTARPALFAPLAVEARVAPARGEFRLDGTVRLAGGKAQVPVRGTYQTAGRRARLAVGPATLQFHQDGLQPAMLGAPLATVSEAKGKIEVSAALVLTPDAPLDASARIDVRDMTAETAQVRIEGLRGTLRLDGLIPPRTENVQTLSARRVTAGLSLEQPSVKFRLRSAKTGTVVLIDRAEGRTADGIVYLDRARFDPSAAQNMLYIGLRGLSLEQLLRDWASKGMAGKGVLSGVVPVAVTREGVVIEAGSVQAEGDGEIKVNWGASRDALIRQSEQVALMARTLEDFRYSKLRITVDRPRDGALAVKVRMLGRNPAVKDGHPFNFNISLSGDLEKIVAAIRQGQRLGADLLRGGIGGAR